MAAPSVATSRILEIACGDGSNLLPIAYSLPQAHCTGFDLATSAIERAHARASSLQLRNVELFAGDIASIGPIGQFDYIVAHGLYSWAPSSLRDALLRLIHRSLAPNGVAFVSYNTFPGWHVAGMVREMLRYHTRGAGDAESMVMQARALLDFLRVAHNDNDPYGRLLASEAERFARHSSPHLFHDDLADVNDPVYFEQFVSHAARYELVHVADADFATMTANDLPAEARAKLEQLRGEAVTFGQYLDFVRCRRFRESLLCRAEVVPASVPVPGVVRALLATSAATATTSPVDFAEGIEARVPMGRSGEPGERQFAGEGDHGGAARAVARRARLRASARAGWRPAGSQPVQRRCRGIARRAARGVRDAHGRTNCGELALYDRGERTAAGEPHGSSRRRGERRAGRLESSARAHRGRRRATAPHPV